MKIACAPPRSKATLDVVSLDFEGERVCEVEGGGYSRWEKRSCSKSRPFRTVVFDYL